MNEESGRLSQSVGFRLTTCSAELLFNNGGDKTAIVIATDSSLDHIYYPRNPANCRICCIESLSHTLVHRLTCLLYCTCTHPEYRLES